MNNSDSIEENKQDLNFYQGSNNIPEGTDSSRYIVNTEAA